MMDVTRSTLDKRSDFMDEKILDGKDSGDSSPEILAYSDEDDDEEGDAEEPEGADDDPREASSP